jgi:hypothetical protein
MPYVERVKGMTIDADVSNTKKNLLKSFSSTSINGIGGADSEGTQ